MTSTSESSLAPSSDPREPAAGPAPDGRSGAGRSRRRLLLGSLAGGGLLLGVLAAAGLAASAPDIPYRTSVAGVAVGGQSAEQAHATLARVLTPRLARPVPVSAAEVTADVDPATAGLSLDLPATVRAARGESGLLPRLAGLLTRHAIPPRSSGDPALRTGAARRLAERVDRAPVEGAIQYEGLVPVGVTPVDGRRLDVAGAVALLRERWLAPGTRLALPVDAVPTRVGPAAVTTALDAVARPAVAAPVTLTVGGQPVEMSPAVVAGALRFVARGGALVPELDPAALRTPLVPALAAVETPGRDAVVAVVNNAVQVTPSAAGRSVDGGDLAAAVLPVLDDPAPRSATVPLRETQPAFTTEAAQALGIREPIGTFTTRHPCCAARVTNIHRMADIVNGAVVKPGDTFSLNGFVGPRDAARGFVSAPMILDGDFVNSVGGGVSQFATTMYNAVFFSGLEDVFHKPHSYYISRYPPGREATVSSPWPDLTWRNDSPTGVLVQTAYTGTSLTVTFWGTKRYDVVAQASGRYRVTSTPQVSYNTRPDCHASRGGTGFSIDITRVFLQGGVEVKRETKTAAYLPEPVVKCQPPPAPAAPAAPPAAVPAG